MRRVAVAIAAAPTPAAAHAFDPGADAWGQILAAAAVPFSEPVILLALVALGLMVGIWRIDGAAEVWPALAAGLVAGSLAGAAAGLWIAFAAILAGLVLSVMAVAALRWPAWLVRGASAVAGTVAGATAFEGHPFGSLPGTVHLGVLLGGLVLAIGTAGLVSLSRARWPAPWVTIGWRIVASWTGAIAMMLAALRFA